MPATGAVHDAVPGLFPPAALKTCGLPSLASRLGSTVPAPVTIVAPVAITGVVTSGAALSGPPPAPRSP
eukprot:CAMPEP_0197648058 /NCGR_PEP_ID=MMETSP1338-20131121/27390_1 /TAXON_ID=43686 ORGANISM="Pelagodinium beii, Strain RCC1491" /NCGR_SAMPLE_ID=MMETSP1338 /ASSEMBLY_ACC=CAM_ASM_000754 /LENGTH=68 /DNA_ID=CAMNT_0043221991 /DNA_START=33 /DNA_END=236 /DNA_ORIENTATION=-